METGVEFFIGHEPLSREKWVRIPERERTHTPLPNGLKEGDWITVPRVIFRTGYYWEPKDMPPDTLEDWAYRYIATRMAMYWDKPSRRKLYLLGQHPDTLIYSPLAVKRILEQEVTDETKERIRLFQDILGKSDKDFFKQVFYTVRGYWQRKQEFPEGTERLRTFWYYEDKHGIATQVDYTVTKQCGKYHHGYGGGRYNYDDYQPAYLSIYVAQPLWKVSAAIRGDYGDPVWGDCYVHPLDIIEGRELYND